MPPAALHLAVKFRAVSGLPADAVINTWNVTTTDTPDASDIDDIVDQVDDFYNAALGGDTLAQWLSASMSRDANAVETSVFDVTAELDGSAHGSPDWTRTFTLGASALAHQLPSEVAVVLSLKGSAILGVPEDGDPDPAIPSTADAIRQGAPATHAGISKPRARRRGRVYIGPLNASALSDTAPNGEAFVHPDLITRLEAGLINLNAGLLALGNVTHLGIWSRRDASVHWLSDDSGGVLGFVDDAFDTQRRRGQRALSRTTIINP